MIKQRNILDESNQDSSINHLVVNKIIEGLNVLFQEFLADLNIDIKEKAKSLIKILNSSF